jgi:Zn-dependent metalloprotease
MIMRCNGYVLLSVFALLAASAQAETAKFQDSPEAARAYPTVKREAQLQAVSAMPQVDVQYGAYGRIRRIEGRSALFLPSVARLKKGDKATELLQRVKGLLMASGSESLIVQESGRPPAGGGYYAFTQQMIQGVPVLDAPVNVLVGEDGEVQMIDALFVPQGAAKLLPDLSAKEAKASLEKQLGQDGALQVVTAGSLAFWTNDGQEETPQLLWMFDAEYTKDGEPLLMRFGVDAATGNIRSALRLSFGLNRSVYTNAYRNDTTTPPASALLWTEGNPSSSDAQGLSLYNRVVEPIITWTGQQWAYDTLALVAHYGTSNYSFHIYSSSDNNKSYLFFGDGRATDDDDIAHEYGHGMYGYVGNQPQGYLWYDEWFAGNEFYADLSAVLTDIRRFGMTNASWAITDLRDWYNPQSKGPLFNDWYPHRYFANPGQPAYSNSTIFGHAVYLMIHGGTHRRAGASALGGPIPSINVIARPWNQIQQVLSYGLWLVKFNNQRWNAQVYKARTIQAATTLYGAASGIPTTVEQAWTAVGIGYNCSAPPPTPQALVQTWYCRGDHDISWNWIANAKYQGQVVAYPWAWESFQTQDVVDGTMTSCHQSVSTRSRYRMRACNACGCSAWTPDEWMDYWSPCQ